MADAYTAVSVSRGSKVVHSIAVPGAEPLAWHLTVVGGLDISLEVVFRPSRSGSSPVVVQPAGRTTDNGGCYRWCEGGELCALVEGDCLRVLIRQLTPPSCSPEPGAVDLVLDNSYSLLRGKTVNINTAVGAVDRSGPLPPAAIYNSELMNEWAMEGARLFLINQFSASERFFEPLCGRVPVFAL